MTLICKFKQCSNQCYKALLEHYSTKDNPKSFIKGYSTSSYELFKIVTDENHQLYWDFKAWIEAVVEAEKENCIEPSPEEKRKTQLMALIGKYEFKTDYSKKNEFLSLPVEWQLDMILNHDEKSQKSITN